MTKTTQLGIAEFVIFFAGMILISNPTFFEIFRTNVFGVLPRDNYEPMLLYFAGDDGKVLRSPFGYRVLYALVGVVPYWISPLISFSELKTDLPLNELRATQALALVSYLSMVVVAAFAYRICRERGGFGPLESAIVGLASFILLQFTAYYGIDPFTIALVSAGLFWIGSPIAFAAILLISVPANEKVALVFFIYCSAHALFARQPAHLTRAALAGLGLLAYFAVRAIFALPGNEH